jgi:hypothetical protein
MDGRRRDRRQQAQALVASGKPAEALAIYDELTAAWAGLTCMTEGKLHARSQKPATGPKRMRAVLCGGGLLEDPD